MSELYVEYLISIGRLDEAAVKLAEIVNDVSELSAHQSDTLRGLYIVIFVDLNEV